MFTSSDISYYIISLGCSKNLVDTERVNGAMISAGYTPAEESVDADILIINTCGFIKDAKEESIEVIFDAIGQQGDQNDGARTGQSPGSEFSRKVVVAGCLTQRYRDEVKADIPEIDLVYGIADINLVHEISRAFNISIEHQPGSNRKPIVDGLSYSYLKISEGCSNNCSYCAIPLIRGGHRSFDPSGILADARDAAVRGARELVIVAQDIARYSYENMNLPGLVGKVSLTDGIEWVRLMYCHPDHIDEALLECINSNDRVVRYLDIPFQHGSDKIIRAMGRKGSGAEYLGKIEKIRKMVPGIRIRSTFMVGFPGEDEGDFRQLSDFLSEAQLDKVGTFIYSPEEGTAAASFPGQVPETVKKERLEQIMAMQQEISEKKLQSMVGETVKVMVEEQIEKNAFIGRSEFDAPEVDGIFYLTADNAEINSIVDALITDADEYDLTGEIV